MQKKASLRFKWTAADVGRRRLRYPDIAWLSFGDVLTVLRDLPKKQWKLCLASESGRRKTLEQQLRAVKVFRDHHVAHPKSRNATAHEIRRLLAAVSCMPETIRPSEWHAAWSVIAAIKTGQ